MVAAEPVGSLTIHIAAPISAIQGRTFLTGSSSCGGLAGGVAVGAAYFGVQAHAEPLAESGAVASGAGVAAAGVACAVLAGSEWLCGAQHGVTERDGDWAES